MQKINNKTVRGGDTRTDEYPRKAQKSKYKCKDAGCKMLFPAPDYEGRKIPAN